MGKGEPQVIMQQLKVGNSTKWYMSKRKSVLENERHKILWDFKIQADHLIPDGKPNLVIVDKKRDPAK